MQNDTFLSTLQCIYATLPYRTQNLNIFSSCHRRLSAKLLENYKCTLKMGVLFLIQSLSCLSCTNRIGVLSLVPKVSHKSISNLMFIVQQKYQKLIILDIHFDSCSSKQNEGVIKWRPPYQNGIITIKITIDLYHISLKTSITQVITYLLPLKSS